MMVFSGSSNRALAEEIAKEMDVKLGEVELSRFANDEARVWVNEKKVPREVVVVQSLSAPTDHHLIEFSLLCDALKRMGAREITAVIPWLGYSKQDKVFRSGEPLSVKVIAQMLQVVRLEKVVTFDLHNPSILGFFDVPVKQLSAKPLLIDYFRGEIDEQTVVVAPDAGAVKASAAFAQELGVEIAYMDKKRDLVTGEVKIVGISKAVDGAKALIVDDMIVTGDTLMEVSAFLKRKGVKRVAVAATHHTYVPGAQARLDESMIDQVVVTNTIDPASDSNKLRVLSVAGLVRETLGE